MLLLVKSLRRLVVKVDIGTYILQRLLLAPWNTSESYLKGHAEHFTNVNITGTAVSIASTIMSRMDLVGVGDPTGVGAGFAFTRIPKLQKGTGKKIKPASRALYNTDADIRTLTKVEGVKILTDYGIPRKEAMRMRRWDIVYSIIELANKSYKEGIGGYDLLK